MTSMREAWVALHLAGGIGDRRKRRAVEELGSPEAVLGATAERIDKACGCGRDRAARFLAGVRDPRGALVATEQMGAEILAWDDEDYPHTLKESYDPPLVLFLKGRRDALRGEAVGIVGARAALPEAEAHTEAMAAVLGRSGFVIVSGLAEGIDGAAHRGALKAGATTIAVLGTGLDRIYPREHRGLAGEIVRSGALVSEFPPGTPALRDHFPRRNRILAGLVSAVVLVQASERSGASITARFALESSRELFVMAAPPWDPRFAGNRSFARDGAPVVQDGEEVALRLGVTPPDESAPPPAALGDLPERQRQVASLLREKPMSADELCRVTGRPVTDLLGLLLELEMAGRVAKRPGNTFALVGIR